MGLNNLRSVQRSIEGLKNDLQDDVAEAAEDGLDRTERLAKRKIVENDAVASTSLYRGFKQTQSEVPTSKGPAKRYTLTNTEPHAKLVEWGTGGHFNTGGSYGFTPPANRYSAPSMGAALYTAILEWIIIKPVMTWNPPFMAAHFISQSIVYGSESDPLPGTPSQPFMRPAWFVEESKVKLDARLQMYKSVRRA